VTGGEVPELGLLRADYPGWEMWRRDDGVYVAWLVLSRPGVLVRAVTVAGLRAQIEAKTGGTGDAG
jgi:hypothetical protein